MGMMEEFLKEREKTGLLRILRPADSRREGKIIFKGKGYFDFSSNDYLGLSGHPKLKDASKDAIEKWGASASASRLLSGDLTLHHKLEEKTSAFKGKESALVFNSGYQANVGIISALCQRGDAIFSDRLNHASLVDGMLLSGAKFFRFNHNDSAHLESLLREKRGQFREALIITETIFSMDGDRCPLKEIVELKERYNCILMTDEAHATGIFGESGSGVAEEEDLIDKVDLVMGTFSKALGSFGAYIAASKKITDYLINSSRSFIYSTALPPAVIAADLAALDLIKNEPFRRKELLENSDYFREELSKRGVNVKGSSQIVPLILGDSEKAIKLSRELQNRGYWVLPIRPPTVPRGESRLRFSFTYHHTKDILERLINDICEISKVSTLQIHR
jgi:8-amino-7-oxononanoate synthase